MKRQILIIGAGPSGSTAAFYLAQAGLDVLLIDKETWPRDKVCGDGQVFRAFDIYREMGIYEEALENAATVITGVAYGSPNQDYMKLLPEMPIIFCTPRRIIDDIIRRAAVEKAGCEFMENCEARGLIIERGVVKGAHCIYHGKPIDIRADVTLIANGSHSMEARQVGIFNEDPDLAWIGVRGYYENVGGMDPRVVEMVTPHKMFLPAGYMWVFPESETTANVGVFLTQRSLEKSGMRAEDFFDWWRDHTDLGRERLGNAKLVGELKGWKLPSCREMGKNYVPGALLLGDTASGIECYMGEGFYEAMESGRVASEVLIGAFEKGDLSEKMLSTFFDRMCEEVNELYRLENAVREYIASDEDTFNDYIAETKKIEDFPQFVQYVPQEHYIRDVLGIDLDTELMYGRQTSYPNQE